MTDRDCIAFLQWSLPRMRMRWRGFRRVRKQVCKRIAHRMHELNLPDVRSYRTFLGVHPAEWGVLEGLCRVTISRYFRDRGVFQAVEREVIPRLARDAAARGSKVLRCWSAGCASGEEPYTLALIWHFAVRRRFPGVGLRVVATDADANMLDRARAACYPGSSLRELPHDLVRQGFDSRGRLFCLRDEVRRSVEFLHQDVRKEMPEGPFDLVLCRNIIFTYFNEGLQRELLDKIAARTAAGGALVVGKHEKPPEGGPEWEAWRGPAAVFRRCARE